MLNFEDVMIIGIDAYGDHDLRYQPWLDRKQQRAAWLNRNLDYFFGDRWGNRFVMRSKAFYV